MSWSGGTYTKSNAGTGGWAGDAVAGIAIDATRHDTQDNDFATGINNCLTKDGQNQCTANLNFGGFRPSNVAAGSAAAPAYTSGGDTDTGAFGPAANVYAIATNGAERIRIGSDGKIAINTTATASGQLTTKSATITVPQLLVQGTATGIGGAGRSAINIDVDGSGGWQVENDASGGSRIFKISDNNGFGVGTTERLRINSSGQIGIGNIAPSFQLQLSTDSAAKPTTNTWTIASDERIKTNVQNYTKGLDEIKQVRPVTYDYNGLGGNPAGPGGISIIAQEIQPIFPECVGSFSAKLNPEDEEETELLNYNGHAITFALINAVKELSAKIEALEAEVTALKGA